MHIPHLCHYNNICCQNDMICIHFIFKWRIVKNPCLFCDANRLKPSFSENMYKVHYILVRIKSSRFFLFSFENRNKKKMWTQKMCDDKCFCIQSFSITGSDVIRLSNMNFTCDWLNNYEWISYRDRERLGITTKMFEHTFVAYRQALSMWCPWWIEPTYNWLLSKCWHVYDI